MKIVMVSGGFDPLHPGHLAYFSAAKRLGDVLCVAVDNDEYVAKKHKVLLEQSKRLKVVRALSLVDFAVLCPFGLSVAPCIEMVRPDIYAVGRHYKQHTIEILPEYDTCQRLNIPIVPVAHDDDSSSSDILRGFTGAIR